MNNYILIGLLIPVLGTTLGSAMVFFMKEAMNKKLEKALLGFAAGAMIYVVIEELIPSANIGKHSNIATMGFAIGFTLMMILDVVLG